MIEQIIDGYPKTWWEEQANRWTGGKTLDEALNYAEGLYKKEKKKTMINSLGEVIKTPEEARKNTEEFKDIAREIRARNLNAELAVKPTKIGILIDRKLATENALDILKEADNCGVGVAFDVEYRDIIYDTVQIWKELISEGFSFEWTLQTGLIDAKCYARDLLETALDYKVKTKIRVVTGSAYKKGGTHNGRPYTSSLEVSLDESISTMFELLKLFKENGMETSIGTDVYYRALEAQKKFGTIVKTLKGKEDKPIWKISEYVYVPFGDPSKNPGAKAYILRRQT